MAHWVSWLRQASKGICTLQSARSYMWMERKVVVRLAALSAWQTKVLWHGVWADPSKISWFGTRYFKSGIYKAFLHHFSLFKVTVKWLCWHSQCAEILPSPRELTLLHPCLLVPVPVSPLHLCWHNCLLGLH